jgi:hypothetical protein
MTDELLQEAIPSEPIADSSAPDAPPVTDEAVDTATLEAIAGDLGGFFKGLEHDTTSGVPASIQSDILVHPIIDSELTAVHNSYVSFLRILNLILKHLGAWKASAPKLVKSLISSATVYNRIAPSSEVTDWKSAIETTDEKNKALSNENIVSYIESIITPLTDELLGLDPLREHAIGACYAHEQGQLVRDGAQQLAAFFNFDLNSFGAQDTLDYATFKPRFLAAMDAFRERFHEVRRRLAVTLQADFEALADGILIGFRDKKLEEPPAPVADYSEVERLIRQALPKELRPPDPPKEYL